VQNDIVHSLEEESDTHNSSPGVSNTAETECQKYQHHATQVKTRSENTSLVCLFIQSVTYVTLDMSITDYKLYTVL
jgi:hypothetical protein